MFPSLDCLGWYQSNSDKPSDLPADNDLKLQTVIQEASENPIYLIFNEKSAEAKKRGAIPIFMYETNQVSKQFETVDYTLAQSEDERIAIDTVAKAIDPNAKISALSTNMISSVNSIGLLRKKIKFLIAIFRNEKKVSENPAFSRRLNQICN